MIDLEMTDDVSTICKDAQAQNKSESLWIWLDQLDSSWSIELNLEPEGPRNKRIKFSNQRDRIFNNAQANPKVRYIIWGWKILSTQDNDMTRKQGSTRYSMTRLQIVQC